MKKLKKIPIMLLLLTLFSMNLFSETAQVIIKTTTGSCPKGSVSNTWTASWTYDSKGHPLQGSGIDCDGNAWAIDLKQTFNGNFDEDISDSTTAWISTFSSEYVELTANQANLSFRIINIQTGTWESDEVEYNTAFSVLQMDISNLESGIYGIVVIKDNAAIQLLDFYK